MAPPSRRTIGKGGKEGPRPWRRGGDEAEGGRKRRVTPARFSPGLVCLFFLEGQRGRRDTSSCGRPFLPVPEVVVPPWLTTPRLIGYLGMLLRWPTQRTAGKHSDMPTFTTIPLAQSSSSSFSSSCAFCSRRRGGIERLGRAGRSTWGMTWDRVHKISMCMPSRCPSGRECCVRGWRLYAR